MQSREVEVHQRSIRVESPSVGSIDPGDQIFDALETGLVLLFTPQEHD